MQSVFGIITRQDLSFSQQIEGILETGCRMFKEDIGIVSSITGDRYIVEYVHAVEGGLKRGQEFVLGETFCAITVQAEGPLGINDVRKSRWNTHPCIKTGLESYIGVPIRVGEQPFGTLNFSSPKPRISPFPDIDLEFVSTLGDWVSMVLSRSMLLDELHLKANHDGLTGLPNRNAFMKRLTNCVCRAQKAPDYAFALLFIDLDGFKSVNDTLGHRRHRDERRSEHRYRPERQRAQRGRARGSGRQGDVPR